MGDLLPFSEDDEVLFDADDQLSMKYNIGCIAPYRINLVTWERGELYWPRRLLHIPTLTSYERSDNNTYNGIKEPGYTILSYTWGRFQVKDPDVGASLPIKGVSWDIPAIQESHFTVDQFHKVLNVMRFHDTEWAWVDIACIDQENIKIKMDEVGKQVSIFRTAKWAFVWLSHSSSETCFRSFNLIDRINGVWSDYVRHDASAEEMKLLLRYLREAFDSICLDPWFTSLWTLQELMLRNDAFVISSEGVIVTQCVPDYTVRGGVSNLNAFYKEQVSAWPMFFNKIASDWRLAYDAILRFAAKIENNPDETKSDYDAYLQSKQIGQLIDSTGIGQLFSNNPNIQYGAAKYRKTEYPEDRVYGIMQIYNIRVGQSVRPDDFPSLNELIEEFGFAINYKSVVQGQAFVHTSTSKPRLSWCITEYSDVPHGVQNISEVRNRSTISKGDSSSVQIQGKACLFPDFLEIHNRDVSGLNHTMGSQLRLYLDGHIAEDIEPGADPWSWWRDASLFVLCVGRDLKLGEDWTRAQETWLRHYRMAKKTCEIHGLDRLLVLELGDFEGTYTGKFRKDNDDNPDRSFLTGLPPRTHIGMLIRRVGDKPELGKPGLYERLGICTWATNPSLEEYRAIKSGRNNLESEYNLMMETYLQEFVSFSKTVDELMVDDITVRIK
ncbi:heterokaryon incompatibility protein-domain-containing protein [Xylaria scruposa]|nr:heterokaryon incompatibility protein-domain-containing protein [Xylaria scruposa]